MALPSDVLETVFRHLDSNTLYAARAVCKAWQSAAESEDLVAASLTARGPIPRTLLDGLLGVSVEKLAPHLPCRPFVTWRGNTVWLYGPPAVRRALKLARAAHGLTGTVVNGRRARWRVVQPDGRITMRLPVCKRRLSL
jgi:hypothetical protein